jgi:hypothetical protein
LGPISRGYQVAGDARECSNNGDEDAQTAVHIGASAEGGDESAG